jgi:F-type H+-transporting ATPase subunit b
MDLKFVTVETFVIQFIILLIVLWVLNKFLFKPYLAYLDKWEDRQKKLEDDYNNIDKLISEADNKKEGILKDARKNADSLIQEAEGLAKSKKESILAAASQEAKSIIESGKAEIEKEKLSMLTGVKSKLTDLVLKFNKKLF